MVSDVVAIGTGELRSEKGGWRLLTRKSQKTVAICCAWVFGERITHHVMYKDLLS